MWNNWEYLFCEKQPEIRQLRFESTTNHHNQFPELDNQLFGKCFRVDQEELIP